MIGLRFVELGFGLCQLLLEVVLLNGGEDSSLGDVVSLIDIANVAIGVAHLADTRQVATGLERKFNLLVRLDIRGVVIANSGVDGLHLGGPHRHQRRGFGSGLAATGQHDGRKTATSPAH